MKSKHTSSKKTLEEVKELKQFFINPSLQRPRDNSSMDWSSDIPEVQFSPLPHVPPAGENVLSPHVPLHNSPCVTSAEGILSSPHVPSPNMDSYGKRRAVSNDSDPSVLNYGNNQPTIASSWNGAFHALSIFGTEESNVEDVKNIHKSLNRIIEFIKHHPANKKSLTREFVSVVRSLWELIGTIFTNKWDLFTFDKKSSLNIRTCVREKIVPGFKKLEMLKANVAGNSSDSLPSYPPPSSGVNPLPTANMSVAPLPSNKKVELVVKKALQPSNMKKSYAQTSKSNISQKVEDVLQLKEAFPSLSADEVGKILKIKDNGEGNKKLRINIMTRGPSRREVIIPMTKVNTELMINSAHIHISNVNKCLKNSKSDIFADFI